MIISELIKYLESAMKEEGDIMVCVEDSSSYFYLTISEETCEVVEETPPNENALFWNPGFPIRLVLAPVSLDEYLKNRGTNQVGVNHDRP